jgi:hypothetical protein
MSEQLKNHESRKDSAEHKVEAEYLPDIEKLNKEALENASEQAEVGELTDIVESKAKRGDEIFLEDKPKQQKQEFSAYTALKSQTYSRTLKRVQQHLSSPERTMSKLMHNKAIEKVSDGVGKTAARPSGILGGGIVAFVGSLLLLYMTKKYGFEYNPTMFLIFLGCGFFLGVLLEFAIFAAKKVRH